MGYDTPLMGDLEIVELQESERDHRALVYKGDNASGKWEPSSLPVGQSLRKPEALIKKLDADYVMSAREKMNLV